MELTLIRMIRFALCVAFLAGRSLSMSGQVIGCGGEEWEQAEFPGGLDSLRSFITRAFSYPDFPGCDTLTGVTTVLFSVEQSGLVSDVRIHRGLHALVDAEAKRVIGSMPAWKPARLDGHPVRSRYDQSFVLSE